MKFKIPKRYWRIAKRLTTAQLQAPNSDGALLSEKDLFELNIGHRSEGLFLGFYSKKGIINALKQYSILEHLHSLGFKNLLFEMDTNDPYIHRFIIYDEKKDSRHLLVEAVLRRKVIEIQMPFSTYLNGKYFETLAIEWLCMQNPKKTFTKDRPQMPGQQYPGLGMASKAVEVLLVTAWRLRLAGLVNTPDHFHNAYLYSRIFYYINPEHQAWFMALNRDLKKYPVEVISWAIEWEAVIDETTGLPMKWVVGEQIVPLHADLKELFDSREYKKWVQERSKSYKFSLDSEKFEKMKRKAGGIYET
jgi:hypothetical protein